jgi:2-polyprenyl-3-methyl-5-hydroxy-6-metoxy-1,4-benzoquinol methylase
MIFDFNVAEAVDFNPWPHSPHTMVLKMIPPGSKVLDVGCASGFMGRELKKAGCKTWGVEVDPAVAERAKRHCVDVAVRSMDLGCDLPFEKEFFDVILLLDVLEHLNRPDLVLLGLTQHLRPDGRVLISLPNIARVEFRLKLLFGQFDYTEGGLISIGHLRHFTRKTSRRMIRECGLKIISEQGTGLASMVRSKMGMELFPTLTAFQFLFECSRQ